MPYETTEQLARRGLVKVILPPGMTLDENSNVVKLDVGELIGTSVADDEPAVEPTVEAPTDTAPTEPVDRSLDGEESVATAVVDGETILIRYRRSFQSRLIQAEEKLQSYYTAIKNALLSYKGVKSRTSWKQESFNRGRVQCAK
ncbi:hypothetical protein RCJ22_05360, partial [Vibrio sp. FNV 38]|nr:hypothetical protein [Vibrio sp. FNV 38]